MSTILIFFPNQREVGLGSHIDIEEWLNKIKHNALTII